MSNSKVMTLNLPAHEIFNDKGELKQFIKENYEKNHGVKPEQKIGPCDIPYGKYINQGEKELSETAFARFRRNHGFKMACIGGLLTGGLVGAAGVAGIWGISKAYTSFKNNKKENDEIIEVTL